jgi:predicted TIM-barrel fold metal-dependent hydrolase
MADAAGLASYLEGSGIGGAVACGFGFSDPVAVRDCNDYILDAGRQDGRIVPFAVLPERSGRAALREAERCLDLGARGIGEIAFYRSGLGRREAKRLSAVARLAGEAGAVVMIHVNEQVGHSYPGKARVDFGELARVIAAGEGVRFLLAHLGGGLCFYEFMPEIAGAFRNVYYDTAAAPFLYGQAVFAFLGRFLPRKTLFGSDFPLLTLERYRAGLSMAGARAREGMLWRNAARLLGG